MEVVMRKNELYGTTTIDSVVFLTRDTTNYAICDKELSTRIIDYTEYDYLCFESTNHLDEELRDICSIDQYKLALYWFLLGVISLVLNAWIPDIWNISSIPYFLLVFLFILPNFQCAIEFIFDLYVNFKGKKSIFKDRFRLNSAVNMVSNAYRDLGRAPSLEEAKKYNTTDGRRKKLIIYYIGLTYIGTFFALAIFAFFGEPSLEAYVCLVNAIFLVFAIPEMLFIHKKLDFLESYTLEKPNNSDIEQVLRALEALDTFESQINNS